MSFRFNISLCHKELEEKGKKEKTQFVQAEKERLAKEQERLLKLEDERKAKDLLLQQQLPVMLLFASYQQLLLK